MSHALRQSPFLLLVSLCVIGCAGGVRENRTITFAPDGKQIAFQHGRDGVFIADSEDAEPTKIFQPDANVIAVSAPLWNPVDKRLIFTTAELIDKQAKPQGEAEAEPDPAGNIYGPAITKYTCWLRGEPGRGKPSVEPIFTALCTHPGYVAANLAVRWHPDGKHILYIKLDEKGHGLFEYDLSSKTSRRVFPYSGSALVFDWAPDNVHLVCVLSGASEFMETGGIAIGKPGDKKWWHIPDSVADEEGNPEQLRSALPVWTRDGGRFAFVLSRKSEEGSKANHALHVGNLSERRVRTLAKGDKPIRDLHWKPDGSRLGYLRGENTGTFHLIDPADGSDRALGGDALCNFLGWDADGGKLAFVAREPLPHDPATSWAFLLLPDVQARNRVLAASDSDPDKMRTVFSDMQVTFPQWSPTDAKLSLWATFRPAYRSWLSLLLDLGGDADDPLRGLSLRPRDPALVLDPASGERKWKAIDARERTQIGHYHLLRREYAEAWHWYEQADTPAETEDHSPRQFVRRFVRGEDALFFQAYCLDKLGRHKEAERKRRRFVQTFLPDLTAQPKSPVADRPAPFGAANLQATKEQLLHWRDLYVAEVFLSLDAVEDGERYFRAGLQIAASDADRLSKALVLTQMLLLRKKHAEYAELATDTVLPLLLRSWKPRRWTNAPANQNNLILAYSDGLSLLPLLAPEFLAGLPKQQVRDLVPRWQKCRSDANDDLKRLGIDLFLQAAADRLGDRKEQQAAAQRIAVNPARREILGDKGVGGMIEGIRAAPAVVEGLRQSLVRR